ncbi:MAG TPA: threonine/serine dehydratase [Longimicrobiales bacterium]
MINRVTTSTIEEAARRLPAVVVRTPLLPARWLTERFGTQVMLKCENLQLAGSFKIRGAYTKVSRLSSYERRRGIITYSSGNHAQAVAMAARFFDIKATVVMPEGAPQVKIDRTMELGAKVILAGTTSFERKDKAEKIAAKEKLTMIPPYDDMDIIAGQGTVGREIVSDWPDVQAILVPVGGGGLIAGIGAWIREAIPNCRIIGVQSEMIPSMKVSLERGEPTSVPAKKTIADGLMPLRPGDITFAHARQFVDEVVTVPDEAMREAAAILHARSSMVVEYSGAAAVAALLAKSWKPEGKRTVCVITGGNIDPDETMKLLKTNYARPSSESERERVAVEVAEAQAEAEARAAAAAAAFDPRRPDSLRRQADTRRIESMRIERPITAPAPRPSDMARRPTPQVNVTPPRPATPAPKPEAKPATPVKATAAPAKSAPAKPAAAKTAPASAKAAPSKAPAAAKAAAPKSAPAAKKASATKKASAKKPAAAKGGAKKPAAKKAAPKKAAAAKKPAAKKGGAKKPAKKSSRR